MSASGETIVRAFYGRVLGGDVEAALREDLTEDFVWENPLPAAVPFAGAFAGATGAARYIESIFAHLDLESFEIDAVAPTGTTVVVLGHETARAKATGRRYTQHWIHAIEVRGGRIARIREYNDSAAVLQALALKVSGV